MRIRTLDYDGEKVEVNIPDQIDIVLDEVNSAHRGRFAFVRNHVSGAAGEKGCITPGISDIWFLSLPRYDRYVARIIAGVESLDILDVVAYIASNPNFLKSRGFEQSSGFESWEAYRAKVETSKTSDVDELFANSRQTVLDRKQGTDPTTAGQRHGQRVCYAKSGNAKVHLLTAPDDTGHKVPTLDSNGRMTAKSIMLPFYIIRRSYSQAPKWTGKKSRVDTIMRDAIENAVHAKLGLAHWKTFSLQKGNFTAISMDSRMILGWVRDLGTAELDASLAEAYRAIGALSDSPMNTLKQDAKSVTAYAG